ncbi:hypothetical protein ACIODW_17785 [Streptomyces sp. NPDC087897]|uniref:hypothetical protein n=1 Tax=Streptomyces sp. NPDC087897 TaxID=3365817 RepID=UPI00382A9C1A
MEIHQGMRDERREAAVGTAGCATAFAGAPVGIVLRARTARDALAGAPRPECYAPC